MSCFEALFTSNMSAFEIYLPSERMRDTSIIVYIVNKIGNSSIEITLYYNFVYVFH